MDNDQHSLIENFNINDEAKAHLGDVAKWATVNAIVSFVTLGVTFVSAVLAVGKISNSGYASGGNLLGVLITAAISLLLNITLLQSATHIKKGLATTDQGFFGIGINKLATYFKIMGILFIIILVIFVLAILVVMLVGMSR